MVKLPDLPLDTLLDIIDLSLQSWGRPYDRFLQFNSLSPLPSTTSPLPSSSVAIGFNPVKPHASSAPRPYLFSHQHTPADVEGNRHSRPSGVPLEGRRIRSRASNSQQLGPVAMPLGVKPGPAPLNPVFMPVLVDSLDALANVIIFEAAKQFQRRTRYPVGQALALRRSMSLLASGEATRIVERLCILPPIFKPRIRRLTVSKIFSDPTSISRRIQKTPDSQIQMKVPDTETYIEAPGAWAATEEHLKYLLTTLRSWSDTFAISRPPPGQVVGVRASVRDLHLQEVLGRSTCRRYLPRCAPDH
ncbi:hypothetical protein EDB83DRAFT_2522211 [Lactarius deliciosus]|nr:hypothetical protein EDB83DRAFT_2522211 [Lactarius deliciosus]